MVRPWTQCLIKHKVNLQIANQQPHLNIPVSLKVTIRKVQFLILTHTINAQSLGNSYFCDIFEFLKPRIICPFS